MIFNMIAHGNGRSAFVEALSVSANGVYSAPEGLDGYNPVTVDVPSGGGNLDEIVAKTISVASGSASVIGSYAFWGCTSLVSANFPAATTIGSYAFSGCTSLVSANFPAATTIWNNAFANCYSLSIASFPAATTIRTSAFNTCIKLTTASFPVATSIGSSAFANCRELLSLYLLGTSVVTLANANAFYTTPISNYTASTSGYHGSIFVPASLYDSYISASNWSYYSSRFVSV